MAPKITTSDGFFTAKPPVWILRGLLVMVGLGIALFSILYCLSVSPYWKLSNDSVLYVQAGQSLAAGNGYSQSGSAVQLYPPGTSAMLAAGWLAGGGSYFVLNAEVVAFALGSMIICFLLFRDRLGSLGAATVVLMCLASTTLFHWSTYLLSDIFYLFFSLLALWFYSKDSASGTGLSVLAAVALRLIGVSLAAALFLDAIGSRKKRWVVAVEMAGVVGLAGLWELRNARLGWSHTGLMLENDPWVPSHGQLTLVGLTHRFLTNVRHLDALQEMVTNGYTANLLAGVLLAAICLIGLRELCTTNSAAGIYCILLTLIVTVYHPWIEDRWLLPLLPFLFACLLLGVGWIAARTHNSVYLGLVLFVALYLSTGWKQERAAVPRERSTPFPGERVKFPDNFDLQTTALWWKQHSSAEDKFASVHPAMGQVMTGRRGVLYSQYDALDVTERKLAQDRAFYVFVDTTSPIDAKWAFSTLEASPRFQLLHSEPHARLYHFNPPN